MIDSNNSNPSWKITIQPIMTDGDGTSNGNYLLLNNSLGSGNSIKINKIIFDVNGTTNSQTMTLISNGNDVSNLYNQFVIIDLDSDFSIFNPLSIGNITFQLKSKNNIFLNYNSNNQSSLNEINITDPVLDIFRESDLITIDLYCQSNINNIQTVFTGTIETINIKYTNQGTILNLTLGGLGNILARSMLVNNSIEQNIQGTLATNLSQSLQLGELITQLIDETYINQLGTGLSFYGGITNGISEIISSSKVNITSNNNGQITDISPTNGSALKYSSWVYSSTPPTSSKMDVILQILYPYQRVFYMGLDGLINITPLQNYFDDTQNWVFDCAGQATNKYGALDTNNYIPILGFSSSKNTAIINNRVLCTLSQILTQFSLIDSGNINTAIIPQSLITPPASLFPRAYDMVQSQLGMQTIINLQEIDGNNIVNNAGLINTVTQIIQNNGKLPGLSTPLVIDGNQSYLQGNSVYDSIKYLTASYGSRSLAQNLKDDLLVDITTAIKYTFLANKNSSISSFRQIPINQLVTVPNTNNNIFDGQRQLFCYGFNIKFDNDGSFITLKLCKPYTYTALWCDKIELLETTLL